MMPISYDMLRQAQYDTFLHLHCHSTPESKEVAMKGRGVARESRGEVHTRNNICLTHIL